MPLSEALNIGSSAEQYFFPGMLLGSVLTVVLGPDGHFIMPLTAE
jgi:hypothetical protein